MNTGKFISIENAFNAIYKDGKKVLIELENNRYPESNGFEFTVTTTKRLFAILSKVGYEYGSYTLKIN